MRTGLAPPTKIAIIGSRGIPNNYGGFERFVELLVDHPSWCDGEFTFVVYGENPTSVYNPWTQLRKISYQKKENPLLYYAKSVYLASQECNIVLSCGCGLSLFALWPRWKSRLLVVNPDGCEWRRTKWPWWLRAIVRATYAPTLLAADRVVLDAESLRSDIGGLCHSKSVCIAYQAPEPQESVLSLVTQEQLNIKYPYVLIIARLEPENNIEFILDALMQLGSTSIQCVVVAPTNTEYYKAKLAKFKSEQIKFIGGIFDQTTLNQLRGSCLAYVHGHSVGGTNPSLLEALAKVGGALLCHDNKYNREVAGFEALYFSTTEQLIKLLLEIISSPMRRRPIRDKRYHPDYIANQYRTLFAGMINGGKR